MRAILVKFALSINEAMQAADVGRTKLYEAIGDGSLKAKKLGRRTLVLAEDLQTWLRGLPQANASSKSAKVGDNPSTSTPPRDLRDPTRAHPAEAQLPGRPRYRP